jgi:hypothetical protein
MKPQLALSVCFGDFPGPKMSGEMPDFSDKLRIVALTEALFLLNIALDSGTAQGVTFQEVYEHLEAGDLIEHLQERLKLQFSLVSPSQEQNKLFIEALRSVRYVIGGRERRKFGVENNGVCMLIAYITELIQSAQWDIGSLPLYGQPG